MNTEFKINPMIGFANSPYLILGKQTPYFQDKVYTFKDGLYYYQDPVTGETDFLAHSGTIKRIGQIEYADKTYDHYITPNHEGFGGRTFRLIVGLPLYPDETLKEIVVDLVGPWSSGCYAANNILPKPAIEVTYHLLRDDGHVSHVNHTGNLTIEIVNEILKLTKWRAILQQRYDVTMWPELVYDGIPKTSWTRETEIEVATAYAIPWSNSEPVPACTAMQYRGQL